MRRLYQRGAVASGLVANLLAFVAEAPMWVPQQIRADLLRSSREHKKTKHASEQETGREVRKYRNAIDRSPGENS